MDRFQIALLIIFIVINVTLLLLAQPVLFEGALTHPAYAFAPDGTRYWDPALSLLRDGTFSYTASDGQAHPLQRGGPIPPLFFAFFIRLVGFDHAPYLFIPAQCALLYFLGLLARSLASLFKVNKNLVQALIVLNPNLIGVAHFAQSEILYSFVLGILILISAQLLTQQAHRKLLIYCVLIGALSGLATLARPASFFYATVLPFLIGFLFFLFDKRQIGLRLRRGIVIAGVIAGVSAIVMAPWAIRNAQVFNSPAIALGSEAQLSDSLTRMLVKAGVGDVNSAREFVRADLYRIAVKSKLALDCFENDQGRLHNSDNLNCKKERIEAYVRLIASQPVHYIAIGLAFANFSTFFVGGATALANIVGMPHASDQIALGEFSGLATLSTLIKDNLATHGPYLFLAVITTAFASICRILGVIGLVRSLTDRSLLPANIFFVSTLLVFIATFLFTGVSRFRAPLEIILMVYAASGIKLWFKTSKEGSDFSNSISKGPKL